MKPPIRVYKPPTLLERRRALIRQRYLLALARKAAKPAVALVQLSLFDKEAS
jgi:hypothetical protein